ncbi:hypothetical protein ACKAV7_004001 [Fusarium commune]
MADQESRPTEWGPGKTPQGRARLPSSRPREKPQLSCNLCRRRKPCSSCVQRELGLSCTYASDRVAGGDAAHQPRVTTQDRIRHLESLVFDLMQQSSVNQGQHGGGTPCSPVGSTRSPVDTAVTTPADYGSMQSTGGGANYVGSSHWAAVLDGIAELKDHFDNEEEASHPDVQGVESPAAEMTGPQLLYGCPKPASKDEILASILTLSRPVVDRLVSRYFNSFEMSPAVLHSVQFLKEYEEFWDEPSAVSPLWLGLLFTIMCLATQFEKFRLDPGVQSPAALSMERDLQKMADTYRLRIGQCLVLGNYTKGGPYVLETLMLYIAAEVFSSTDAEIDIWILTGNTVQIALHMGYHRDPKHFKGMSSFAEMRRRNTKRQGMQVSESAPMDETILVSLRRSYDIWLQSSNSSKEARKVVQALAVVLGVSSTSDTDSGFDLSMSFGVPSGYASSSINDYQPEIPAGLGSQFPVLDGTMMPNWATFADDYWLRQWLPE